MVMSTITPQNARASWLFNVVNVTNGFKKRFLLSLNPGTNTLRERTGSLWFEMIEENRENINLPFDVEACRTLNPDFVGTNVAAKLIIGFANEMLREDGYHGLDESDWQILESSSAKKFSFHLLLNSPRAPLFQGLKYGAGAFAKRLLGRWKERKDTDPEWAKLSVKKEKIEEVQGKKVTSIITECAIDVSIYSRNRQYRCAYCNKLGAKERILKPLEPIPEDDWTAKTEVFLKNLVCADKGWNWGTSRIVIEDPPHTDSITGQKAALSLL
jgi:hypothetical protein